MRPHGDGDDWVNLVAIKHMVLFIAHHSTYTYPPTMTLMKSDDGTMETAEDAMLRELQVLCDAIVALSSVLV